MKQTTKALCFIFDSNYISQGKYAIESAKRHNPDYTTILLTDSDTDHNLVDIQLSPRDILIPMENWLIVGRVAIVAYALEFLNFDTVIFLDGDTYTYNDYLDLQQQADAHSIVVIPHITMPLPNDDKFPQNRIISLSGNYNTGVWAASQTGLSFIKWWTLQTATYPVTMPEAGLVNEQGWLRFAGDFNDNIKIFRHPGYNVAYWNIKQRTLEKIDNIYYIDNKKLAIMHFSGLNQSLKPEQMSIFQNRYLLEKNDLAYEIYNNYYKLIWS